MLSDLILSPPAGAKGQRSVKLRAGRCCRSHLLPGDRHVVLHLAEDSWLDEVASVCSGAATAQQLGSFPLPGTDVAKDLLILLFVHLRAIGTDKSAQCLLGVKKGSTAAPPAQRWALAAPHFTRLPSQLQKEMRIFKCQFQGEVLE